jgi:protein TonB
VSEPAAAPTAPPAPPAPPRVELPSSSADYLNNPRPPYPPLSKRLGEQGKVVVRVFIEANGAASKAEIRSSSGYDRLDQTALQTVLKWRYAPGKRNGVAEAMWFNVPISFVLE